VVFGAALQSVEPDVFVVGGVESSDPAVLHQVLSRALEEGVALSEKRRDFY
jgi:hypothetical protein